MRQIVAALIWVLPSFAKHIPMRQNAASSLRPTLDIVLECVSFGSTSPFSL